MSPPGAATPDLPPWNERRQAEPHAAARGGFVVDRDRIVHCETFRELQYKTQVQSLLYAPDGAVFRTRLNHVIEVAQVARALARGIGADETLAEAVALGHDLGHPPFGHAGERALRDALVDHGEPAWNANVHSLAVVDEVECSFIELRGLNLTWACREGIARHSTPFDEPVSFGEFAATPNGGLECQIVDAADVLAYLSHDLDDALVGRYLELADVAAVSPLLDELVASAERRWTEQAVHVWPDEERPNVVRRAVIAQVIASSIGDLIETSAAKLASLGAAGPEEVRAADDRVVLHSADSEQTTKGLLDLLVGRYYRSEAVAGADADAGKLLRSLFEFLLEHLELVPRRFRGESDVVAVATYIASLNDRSASSLAHDLGVAQTSAA